MEIKKSQNKTENKMNFLHQAERVDTAESTSPRSEDGSCKTVVNKLKNTFVTWAWRVVIAGSNIQAVANQETFSIHTSSVLYSPMN